MIVLPFFIHTVYKQKTRVFKNSSFNTKTHVFSKTRVFKGSEVLAGQRKKTRVFQKLQF